MSTSSSIIASCAYRAKYRITDKEGRAIKFILRVETSGVHKGNRAAVYPAGVACKRLCGDVLPAGFLKEEIYHVGVAVQEPPPEELIRRSGPPEMGVLKFPADRKSSLSYNVDMCSKDDLLKSCFDAPFDRVEQTWLSHNHMMLVIRAFLTGAEWNMPPDTDKNITFCDVDGKLSLSAVAASPNGKEMKEAIEEGFPCEMLSWKMDLEEPLAASVISQALNEPQSMSMRTTELTAISVLKGEVISQMGARPSLARSESEDSLLPEIFNVEYFRDYPSPRGCEIHNHALKYFRHDAEKTGRDVVIFDNTDPVKMKEMVIASPTEFKFIGGPTTDWHWHELVAKLDDKSLVQVVEGWREDPNRSRGLVCCRLQKTDRCDQTRDRAQKQQGVAGRILHTEEQLMIWDFVLVRANGTEVWLHPNYASENVECLEPCGPRSEVPKSGLGGTSVPGCPHVRAFGYPFCKYCKNKNLKTILHFKAN
jgi:hypothetical protein